MLLMSFALASADRRSEDVRILAVVVAELKLGDIERHVLRAHLVEGPDHTALEDRPEAFDRIRVDRTMHILPKRVLDKEVRIFGRQGFIGVVVVGRHQTDFVGNDFADESLKRVCVGSLDHAGNDITLAADSAHDWRLALGAARAMRWLRCLL